jgi:hypothetical protein
MGTLKALGIGRWVIFRAFALEACFVCVVGAGIGMAFAAGVIGIMGVVGVPIVNPLFHGYFYVFPRLDFVWMGTILAVFTGLGGMFGFFPAYLRSEVYSSYGNEGAMMMLKILVLLPVLCSQLLAEKIDAKKNRDLRRVFAIDGRC